MKNKMIAKLIIRIIVGLASLVAWVYLFVNHTQIGIALFFIMLAELLERNDKIKEVASLKSIFSSK